MFQNSKKAFKWRAQVLPIYGDEMFVFPDVTNSGLRTLGLWYITEQTVRGCFIVGGVGGSSTLGVEQVKRSVCGQVDFSDEPED